MHDPALRLPDRIGSMTVRYALGLPRLALNVDPVSHPLLSLCVGSRSRKQVEARPLAWRPRCWDWPHRRAKWWLSFPVSLTQAAAAGAPPCWRFSNWASCWSFRAPGPGRGQGKQAAAGCRPVNGNSGLHDNLGSTGGVNCQGPYWARFHHHLGQADTNRTCLKGV